MILVIGPRLEGHSVIFLAIHTPLLSLSPRRRFPRPTPERVFSQIINQAGEQVGPTFSSLICNLKRRTNNIEIMTILALLVSGLIAEELAWIFRTFARAGDRQVA